MSVSDPGRLVNPYRVIVVRGPDEVAAGAFVDWLASPRGRAAILAATPSLDGAPVYTPVP